MRTHFFHGMIILVLSGLMACESDTELAKSYPGKTTIKVENPSDLVRKDAFVKINLSKIAGEHQKTMLKSCSFVLIVDGQEVPSQLQDKQLYFLADFTPGEKKKVMIRYALESVEAVQYPQRAHAELSRKEGGRYEGDRYVGGKFTTVTFDKMPPNHVDHDTYYRYEGPGWESDQVAYRFYLDPRNCIDIFGKNVSDMVLPNVGLDGTEAYLQMADWGGDIFKVSTSLGIGSIAAFYNGAVQKVSETDSVLVRILADGPVQAEIQTNYHGWQIGGKKYDLQSNLSICGGSRLTRQKLQVTGGLEPLATGLVKHDGCNYFEGSPNADSKWNYIALWGKQSLAGDNLGTALFFKSANLIEITEDELNHLVILNPQDGNLKYYFAAAWEGEPGGIKTQTEFVNYLDQTVQELNGPIKVIY